MLGFLLYPEFLNRSIPIKMKDEVFEYLNNWSYDQSRPTILEILRDTSCKTVQQVDSLYREWLSTKYKVEEKDEE